MTLDKTGSAVKTLISILAIVALLALGAFATSSYYGYTIDDVLQLADNFRKNLTSADDASPVVDVAQDAASPEPGINLDNITALFTAEDVEPDEPAPAAKAPTFAVLTPSTPFPTTVAIDKSISKIIPGMGAIGIGIGEHVEVSSYDAGTYMVKYGSLELRLAEEDLSGVIVEQDSVGQ